MHDLAWCRPWLEAAPVVRAGDGLLADRGLLDGAPLSAVPRQRRVAGIIPLKANLLAAQAARQRAAMAGTWQTHPSRPEQTIALVRGVEPRWAEGEVPLHAWVMRFWQKKKTRTDPIIRVTTDLRLSAPWMVRHYEERPASEQDDEQRQSGGGQLKTLRATR